MRYLNIEMQIEEYRREKIARQEREMRERLSVSCSSEEMLMQLASLGGLNTSERIAVRLTAQTQKTAAQDKILCLNV